MHFGDNSEPVPAVDFVYPSECEAVTATASYAAITFECRLQGFRTALHFIAEARTAQARNVRLECMLRIITQDNEPITAMARRLRVSREHLSREIAKIQNMGLLT